MTVQDLISDLRRRDVRLWLEGATLRYDAPSGALTPPLLSALRQHKGALVDLLARADAAAEAIEPVPREGDLELSFGQQRLWFLDQLEAGSVHYNQQGALRLEGRLDTAALNRALDEIVRRHESLRTTFRAGEDGRPVQVVQAAPPCALLLDDLRPVAGTERENEVRRLAREEARRPFDLTVAPLFRARLLRMSDDEHVLVVTLHHIVSDAWSIGVVSRELATLYTAFREGRPSPLSDLPVQYADFAAWQRRRLRGSSQERPLAFWRERLAGVPVLDLPFDRPRPAVQTFHGATASIEIGAEVTDGLRRLSAARGATLFMTVLTALEAALSRWSGQTDFAVGTPIAGRLRAETEGLIGFFLNTLVLRADLSGDPTFEDALARVHETALAAYAAQEVPFEWLVEELAVERDLGRSPLFSVMFVLQHAGEGALSLPGLTVRPFPVGTETSKFDLTLFVDERASGLTARIEYNTDLFDAATIDRWCAHLANLLAGVVRDPRRRLSSLPLAPEAEQRTVTFEWNATAAPYPDRACLHDLVEAQVARDPHAIAVRFEGATLSRRELDARANGLAWRLRAAGVGPDDRVGISAERSLEMVIGLLAVLKAGGAYLPLDPEDPEARLAAAVADARPRAIVGPDSWARRLGPAAAVVSVDAAADAAAARADAPTRGALGPDHLAYVIYTSGSTGTPKGVMCTHRGIVNRLDWMQARFALRPDDRVLQKTPLTFDVSVWEVFWPLLAGAPLVLARPGGHRDARYLADTITREGITTVHFVPSMLDAFLEDDRAAAACRPLRRVICSGEALPPDLVRRVLSAIPQAELHNLYGPTEASVDVSAWQCRPMAAGAAVPIGRPIANTQLHVLDDALRPAPIGVAGELYIGGVGLARGYWNRAALTAERFVPDPFAPQAGARLYRTGDRARWRADGEIEFLGRRDHQVKLRGFRVELGEIEAVLRAYPGVRAAIVTAPADPSGDRRLLAYVVGEGADPDRLRAHLEARLPAYMVPSAFIPIPALPLTSSGKVDRKALPRVDAAAASVRPAPLAPRTDRERRLAAVWAEVLGLRDPGVRDDFFAMGGDSIRSLRLVARARAAGIEIALRDLFRLRTIEALAAAEGNGAADAAPATAPFSLLTDADRASLAGLELDDAYPMAALQMGMVFHSEYSPETAVYHDVFSYRLAMPFDEGALRAELAAVFARHPALRTSFVLDGARALQLVHTKVAVPFTLDDWRDRTSGEQERLLTSWLEAERHRALDWTRAPLLRFHAQLLRDAEVQLTLSFHHSVLDGWSVASLLTELFGGYFARLAGRPLDPGPPPSAFRDFVALERETAEAGETKAFWETQLAGVAVEPLPRLATASAGAVLRNRHVELDGTTQARLRALARDARVPLKSVLLAAHLRVVRALAGGGDVVTGLVSNGRPETEGAERALGLFLNTPPLRCAVGGRSWRELSQAAFEAERVMMPHRRFPLAALRHRHGPLFETAFNYVHFHVYGALAGLEDVRLLSAEPFEETDLPLLANFTVDPATEVLALRIAFADARFSEEQLDRVAGYYDRALRAAARDPHARALAEPLLGTAERRDVLEAWSRGSALDRASGGLHETFEAQAQRTPDSPAVLAGGRAHTYAELDARAEAIAVRLHALGVGPESRVGVALSRSFDLVASLLGILKTGAAYVPLDPAYPAERLALLRTDARLAALVTESSLLARVPAGDVPVVRLDEDSDASVPPSALRRSRTRPAVTPESLAYVIYTSGSTGTPKGVAITHASAVAFVAWARTAFSPAELRGVLAATSICFDLSVFEIFVPLAAGGRVILADSVFDLATLAEAAEISLVNTVPSAAEALLAASGLPPSVRTVNLAGEPLTTDLVRRLYGTGSVTRVHDLYGPSEDTTYSTSALRAAEGPATIGRPIAGTRAYVLDGVDPAPIGVAGELCLAGDGLARGYLGRPAATAERFVPDPFATDAGARMYRTGDLARWTAQGQLEFLGRIDRQVKIRGFRIEPGEVEAALVRHPSVTGAVVVARPDPSGGSRLIAYVASEAPVSTTDLRAFLRSRVPEHLVPAIFVALARIPRLPNGKVDLRALPPPPDVRPEGATFVAPRNPIEEQVASLFAEVLGAGRVGIHDSFFELGGHSLSATQLVARFRTQMGADVDLRALFAEPTVAAVAARMASRGAAGGLEPLVPVPRDARLPLSFAQQRLAFLERLEPGSPVYNIPMALRIDGPLDTSVLSEALAEVVRRHETLRTSIRWTQGAPEAVIGAPAPWPLPIEDFRKMADAERESAVVARARAEAATPFALDHGPLMRTLLIRVGEESFVLVITLHHVVADAWSIGTFLHELSVLYDAFRQRRPSPLADLPVQYVDYAAWQRRALDGAALERSLAYWTRALVGVPPLDLPADRARPRYQTHRGAVRSFRIDATLTEALRALGRSRGTTLFMTLLAAFEVLLHRYSGQEDFGVGIPVAGRPRPETEGVIGLFVNTLALRADLSRRPTFVELLARVRETTLDALAHQELPFERLVSAMGVERDLSRSPLFQVLFVHLGAPAATMEVPGLSVRTAEVFTGTAKFDLTLSLTEGADGGLTGAFEYALDLFEAPTVDRMIGHFITLLGAIARAPETRIARLPLLSAAEGLVSDGQTSAIAWAPDSATVVDLFTAQAERTPDAVAVVDDGERLSYGELDRRARALAATLAARGVGREVPVGLCVERSADMVVGLLGILRAGGAYLPLDPDFPPERLAFMVEDSGLSLVVTHARARARLPPTRATILDLTETDRTAGEAPPLRSEPAHLAYVLYTSGSTGRPKGVLVTHAALGNLLGGMQALLELGPRDAWCAVTSLSFDIAALEILLPLVHGARVQVVSGETARDARALGDALAAGGATWMQATPSTWRMLVDAGWRPPAGLGALCGGEALPPALGRELAARCARSWNVYGPTETTIWSTAGRIDPDADHHLLGAPIANTDLYVLDDELQTVPPGVPGELFIGGAGLARGYLGRPGLTAERFVPDAFSGRPGARLYRTGDRVRRCADGGLEFLGRRDQQLKVRGFRVEPGEIETALAAHPAVRAAVVTARPDTTGGLRLVAYVVAAGEPTSAAALRAHLRDRLPDYMVPSVFVTLPALPLTPNGKVDRRALPAPPDGAGEAAREYVMPRTADEIAMAQIWSEVLGVPRVGVQDDFFALGGHSLLAVRMMALVEERMGARLPLALLFEAPTVEALAARARSGPAAERSAAVLLRHQEGAPTLFLFAGGGGNVVYFHELVRHLDRGFTVYGLQPSYREEAAAAGSVVEAWAAESLEAIRSVQPRGPYRLAGHSLGGQVAYEVALRLQDAGETGVLALLDSGAPYEGSGAFGRDWDEAAWVAAFLTFLGRAAGTDLGVGRDELAALSSEGRLARVLEALRVRRLLPPEVDAARLRAMLAAFKAAARSAYRPRGAWHGRTLFLRARDAHADDVAVDDAQRALFARPARGWEQYATRPIEAHEVAGDHVSMLADPHVRAVAERLREMRP